VFSVVNVLSMSKRWCYGFAIFVFLMGYLWLNIFLSKGVSELKGTLLHLKSPGWDEITLSETGKYTLFYQYPRQTSSAIRELPRVGCAVVSKTTGAQIELSQPQSRLTYLLDNHYGISLFQFEIKKTGIYQFLTDLPREKKREEIVLTIGHNFTDQFKRIVLGGLSIFFGSAAIGVAIAGVIFSKRRKIKGSKITRLNKKGKKQIYH